MLDSPKQTMRKANPQGKGRTPILETLNPTTAHSADASLPTPVHQLLEDYLISRLILCARFEFRVNANTAYYLYAQNQTLTLSLVAPEEWGSKPPGLALGECRMRPDRTWTLALSPDKKVLTTLKQVISKQSDNYLSDLADSRAFADTLPDYDSRLPFQRRALAHGLARTMRRSKAFTSEKNLLALLQENRPTKSGTILSLMPSTNAS